MIPIPRWLDNQAKDPATPKLRSPWLDLIIWVNSVVAYLTERTVNLLVFGAVYSLRTWW
jgi:hypothetical protein